ncbi:hypothetical protein GALL_416940 [mine drainage metagenome]|uniref:Uncharacterized protein n=1 Tax=mine drainage metagenome TaxID=410659 RepID=A0A1J5QKS2_9ZZZZ
MKANQTYYSDREDQQNKPSTLSELEDCEDYDNYRGSDAGCHVDGHLDTPATLFAHVSTLRHSKASHREAHEHADCVEGNELVYMGSDDEQQGNCQRSENDNAIGESEPVAALHQLSRQESIFCNETGQEGETTEGGIGPRVKDKHGRELH